MPPIQEEYCEFVTALLAHDISNYNQTSCGYLEMLLEEKLGPLTNDQIRAVSICLRQANRIQSLIESIRLIDELQELPLSPEPLDLDEAIREAMQIVQRSFAEREIRFRFISAKRSVLAEAYLVPLFTHLFSNATRFNDSEIVEVDVNIAPVSDPDNRWLIQIIDNGEGIPPGEARRAFNRVDNRNMHGHGMGLSLVKFLVERWGGKVWLAPEAPDQGTNINLTLPRHSPNSPMIHCAGRIFRGSSGVESRHRTHPAG